MKLLIVGMSDNPGGIEKFLMTYLEQMDLGGAEIDFLVFSESCAYSDIIQSAIGHIFYLRTPQFKRRSHYKKALKAFFTKNQYDTIWFNACDLANAIVLKVAKECGVKRRIVHAHNNRGMYTGKKGMVYHYFHEYYKKRIVDLATNFWGCSKEAGEYFYPESVLKEQQFRVIYNAIDTKQYRFDQQKRDTIREKYSIQGKKVVGNIARFQYQKNHEFLLDIFTDLYAMDKDYRLLLVGDGENRENIDALVKSRNLEDVVIFVGSVPNASQYYNAMDVFVLPSRFEGLGIVLVEAQTSGLPVFASADVIPRSVRLCDLLTFIRLEDGSKAWADRIDAVSFTEDRAKYQEVIAHTDYEIQREAQRLQKLLMEKVYE